MSYVNYIEPKDEAANNDADRHARLSEMERKKQAGKNPLPKEPILIWGALAAPHHENE